jgi:hypothetical protein
MASCPICNKEVAPRGINAVFPFCSPRCKTIDLGKWLSEEYRVPVEEEDSALDDEPDPDPKGNVRH